MVLSTSTYDETTNSKLVICIMQFQIEVKHYQYIAWDEGGIPHSSGDVMELIRLMQASIQREGGNALVHCR